jgi:hypothetical protein
VQTEADHEQDRERDLVGVCRLADRESLREVVEPDPGRDRHRQMERLIATTDGGLGVRHGAGSDARATPSDRLAGVEQLINPTPKPTP